MMALGFTSPRSTSLFFTSALLGFLLVGCTQIAPPRDGAQNIDQKQQNGSGPSLTTPTPAVTPDPAQSPVPPVVNKKEVQFSIFADPARYLYQYMQVKKSKGASAREVMKIGKNYICYDLSDSYRCDFVFLKKGGAVKENSGSKPEKDESQIMKPAGNIGKVDQDLFVLDAGDQSAMFDVLVDNAKMLYENIESKEEVFPMADGSKGNFYRKNAKNIECSHSDFEKSHKCRFYMNYESGEVQKNSFSKEEE